MRRLNEYIRALRTFIFTILVTLFVTTDSYAIFGGNCGQGFFGTSEGCVSCEAVIGTTTSMNGSNFGTQSCCPFGYEVRELVTGTKSYACLPVENYGNFWDISTGQYIPSNAACSKPSIDEECKKLDLEPIYTDCTCACKKESQVFNAYGITVAKSVGGLNECVDIKEVCTVLAEEIAPDSTTGKVGTYSIGKTFSQPACVCNDGYFWNPNTLTCDSCGKLPSATDEYGNQICACYNQKSTWNPYSLSCNDSCPNEDEYSSTFDGKTCICKNLASEEEMVYNSSTNTCVSVKKGGDEIECVCKAGEGVETCETSVSGKECEAKATCQKGYESPEASCEGTTCTSMCQKSDGEELDCNCELGEGVASCKTSVSGKECTAEATCQTGYESPQAKCDGTKCTSMCTESKGDTISCEKGYYSPTGSTKCDTICPAGSYCPAVTDLQPDAGSDQNINACPEKYTSDKASSDITNCYTTCSKQCTKKHVPLMPLAHTVLLLQPEYNITTVFAMHKLLNVV